MVKKRILSILLVVCLVAGLLPELFPAQEVEAAKRDMFNLDISQTLSDSEKNNLKNNPYGTDGWFSLLSKNELVESRTKESSGRSQMIYRYDTDKVTSRKKESEFSMGKNIMLINTVACDPTGTGRNEYIANITYNKSSHNVALEVTSNNKRIASLTVDNAPFLKKEMSYQSMAHMGITAGDFDGDGKDTIIIYRPDDLIISEYSFNGKTISKVRDVMSIGKALGPNGQTQLNAVKKEDNDDSTDELRGTPSICLTTEDTDLDGKDELVFTASWNDLEQDNYKLDGKNKSNANWQCSYINIAKLSGSSWSQIVCDVLEKKYDPTAANRLRFAGVTVGNVATSSGSDYPEIIVGGFIDQDGGDDCDIYESKFAVYVYRMTEKNGKQNGYERALNGEEFDLNGFTDGGLYDSDKIQDPLCVTAFAADGLGKAELLFVEGDVYSWDGSTFTYKERYSYFNNDDDGIGRFSISNAGVVQAVAGNFDGNSAGREQLAFTTAYKYKYGSGFFWNTWLYYHDSKGKFGCQDYGWSYYDDGESVVSLAAADVGDKDGLTAKIKSKELQYTKPEVIAILESTPYYTELSTDENGDVDLGESATEYGVSRSSGTAESSSTSISAGAFVGGSVSLFAGLVEISAKETITNEWTWETTVSEEKSYTITYSNNTEENVVIMYRAPVTIYTFDVQNYTKGAKTHTGTLQIGLQGTPTTSMITVEEYNDAASAYDMDEITDSMIGQPGNPASYHQTLPVSMDDPNHSWQSGTIKTNVSTLSGAVPYRTVGTISQELEVTNSTEQSSSYTFNSELEIGLKVGEVETGATVGGGFGNGTTTIDSSSTIKTGTVSGRPKVLNAEKYDFDWHFATWSQKLNNMYVPVMGYIITGEQSPPSPAQNLALSDHTANSMKLTWEAGIRPADEYIIYRYKSRLF